MCTRPDNRGFTLVELVILIAVVAIGLAGILLVFSTAVRSSADPQARKQAVAIAEAMLDEILLNSYDPLPGTGSRANFDDVDDYNGYSIPAIVDINGNAIASLAAYKITNVTVCLAGSVGCIANLNGVTEAKRVTVTVGGPNGLSIAMDGYRLRYVGP